MRRLHSESPAQVYKGFHGDTQRPRRSRATGVHPRCPLHVPKPRISRACHRIGLPDFDFDADVGVSQPLIQELATLRFLDQGENVLFLGPPRVGKSHLATGLALKAIEHRHRSLLDRSITVHDLVDRSRSMRCKTIDLSPFVEGEDTFVHARISVSPPPPVAHARGGQGIVFRLLQYLGNNGMQ